MSFIWPPLLLTVLLVPVGVAAYNRIGARRRERLAVLAGTGLASAATATRPGQRSLVRERLPGVLVVLAFALLAIAAARPQATLALPRAEGTVILAFDISASMSANDLKPTRMEAAKAAAKAFVAAQPAGVVVGIVAFSDAGIAVQPPTSDPAALDSAIDRLVVAHGTSLGQGILAAIATAEKAEQDTPPDYYSNRSPEPTATPVPVAPGSHGSVVIVLLSDGENNEAPDPIAAAQAAADRGIRIDTVGIGSPGGATLDLDGFQVHTQLDEATLRQIATTTAGEYRSAADAATLLSIYRNLDPRLVLKSEPVELTGAVAAFAVALLVAGGALSLAWLGRLP